MRMGFNRMFVMTALAAATLLATAGCTPWATYPRVKGMTEIGTPSTEPVPTLMARAISYIKENECAGAQFAVNLPPGVPVKVYNKVFDDLGYTQPMTSAGEPAYHVIEVRLRGMNAEVDVIYPFEGEYALSTVKFHNSVVPGWNVVDTRRWNIKITVPEPNYAPEQALATQPTSTSAAP